MQASMLPSLLMAQESNNLYSTEKAKTCCADPQKLDFWGAHYTSLCPRLFLLPFFHRSGRLLNVPKNNFLFAEAVIRTVPNDRIVREHGIVCPYKHR